MRTFRIVLTVFALLVVPLAATARDLASIALSGVGVDSGTLTAADLAKFPVTEMEVSFMTKKGMETGRYKGVLLWPVLQEKGLAKLAGDHHDDLAHTFLVTADDGYKIAFSVGEIAPDFGNRAILIATERDGKSLQDEGFRLVVPGDARGARSVKGVVSIEIK
jgi:hypothetical protein